MKKFLYLFLSILVIYLITSCHTLIDKFEGVWIPIRYTEYYEIEIVKSGDIYIIKYSNSNKKEFAEYDKGKLIVFNYNYRNIPYKYIFYDEKEDHLIVKNFSYNNTEEFYRKRK